MQLHASESPPGAPSGHHDGDSEFAGGIVSVIAECGGEWVSVLAARFNNLPGKTLSDFDSFGEAAA